MILCLNFTNIYSLFNTIPQVLNGFVAVLACGTRCMLQNDSPPYIVLKKYV